MGARTPVKPQHEAILSATMITGAVLATYVSLLSTHYDPNGITEVMAVESGDMADLFLPRRILYRAMCHIFWQLLKLGGYAGPSLLPSQILTAIFGALGTGVLFLILHRLTGRGSISLLITSAYAFSYGYWVHSEDVNYIIPATFFILVALYFLVSFNNTNHRRGYVLLSTVSSALAICFWQTNVFFTPAAILSLARRDSNIRNGWRDIVVSYLIPLVLILGALYLVIGYCVGKCRDVKDFMTWITTYSTTLPVWGVFRWSRLKESAITLIATVLPFHYGFGLRSLLLQGKLVPGKMISLASLISFFLMTLGWGGWAIGNWQRLWKRHSSWLMVCLAWLIPYILFNTWWDPYEVKWWLIPIIPLWISLALILTEARAICNDIKYCFALKLTGLAIGVVILANLIVVILPNHSAPDKNLEKAIAFGHFMGPQDLLISAAWDWTLYIPYFTHREVLNLISVSAEGRKPQRVLQLAMTHRDQQGGRVFLADVYSYTDEQWAQLTDNTGLKPEDFGKLERSAAWEYEGEVVWRITQGDISVKSRAPKTPPGFRQ